MIFEKIQKIFKDKNIALISVHTSGILSGPVCPLIADDLEGFLSICKNGAGYEMYYGSNELELITELLCKLFLNYVNLANADQDKQNYACRWFKREYATEIKKLTW